MEVAIEAKSTKRVTPDHLKGLYKVKEDQFNAEAKNGGLFGRQVENNK
jgi:hypothetical protein